MLVFCYLSSVSKYNSFWNRFFAGLLDGLILVPLMVIVILFQFLNDSLVTAVISMIIVNMAPYLYSVYFHGTTGQTPGKKMMSIRVIHKSELRTLTIWEAIRRDSFYIILATFAVAYISIDSIQNGEYIERSGPELILDFISLGWFLLEIITMMTNEKRRAFHDYLADSVVIKDDFWVQREPTPIKL